MYGRAGLPLVRARVLRAGGGEGRAQDSDSGPQTAFTKSAEEPTFRGEFQWTNTLRQPVLKTTSLGLLRPFRSCRAETPAPQSPPQRRPADRCFLTGGEGFLQ